MSIQQDFSNQIRNEAPISANNIQQEVSYQTQIKHETTLFAEPVFHIGDFTVTNSLLNSWVVVFIIVVISLFVRKSIAAVPRGIQNYLEVILEETFKLADSVTNSREKTLKFMALVLPLFFFILLNNWLGLLPGVGSIGFLESGGGEKVFVPIFRGGTADLNTTLALALVSVVFTHISGVVAVNFWQHINKFFGINLILEIPRKVFKEKDFTAILINPVKFFVGLVEVVGEFAKVASLSFRLFGNIFAGEVLLGAMAVIFAYVIPIPFIFLEIIVGLIQALIFAMLILVFLTIMTTGHEESH